MAINRCIFGVAYMLTIVFSMPRLGTAATTVAVISGQLLMSLLIDHFGWLNNPVIHLDGSRLAAIALLAVALFLSIKVILQPKHKLKIKML